MFETNNNFIKLSEFRPIIMISTNNHSVEKQIQLQMSKIKKFKRKFKT